MKNLIAIILVSFCYSASQGQEAETISRTILKLSPQHFTDNSLKAGVERFNKNHSTSFAIFLTAKLQNNADAFDQYGYNGLAGEFQFRKYVSPMKIITSKRGKSFHQGIYGAAYIQGGSYSGQFSNQESYFDPTTGMRVTQWYNNYDEDITNGGLGFTIGYQKTLWQVLFLEAFVGGGIQFSDRKVTGQAPEYAYYDYDTITDPAYKGILPKIGMNIGIGL